MSLEIRIATTTDACVACAVLRRSISECCARDHGNDPAILQSWLGNKTPETVTCWFMSPTNFSLVAVEADVIVGVALLTRAGRLALCYLLPDARRRGIGHALLERIEAQARAWEIDVLQLHSTATAEKFYARHGYLSAGNVRSSYGIETILFWKQLNADATCADPKRKPFCSCNRA
jgi:GNAT superfamily N-acetyltransferase